MQKADFVRVSELFEVVQAHTTSQIEYNNTTN